MSNLRLEEYRKAFIFGVKLAVLLSLLAVPPVIGFTLSSWADNLTQRFPILYTSELKITQVQDFEFKYAPQYWTSVNLTSGKKIYFAMNRAISGSDEYKRATDEVLNILIVHIQQKRFQLLTKIPKQKKVLVIRFLPMTEPLFMVIILKSGIL